MLELRIDSCYQTTTKGLHGNLQEYPLAPFQFHQCPEKMPRNPFQTTAGNQQRKSSSFGSFVTVNSRSLSANRNGGSAFVAKANANIGDFHLPGRVWECKLTPDECCYHIVLQAKGSFVVVFVDEEDLPELAGVLRSLISTVISITLKTQRAQAAKALSAAATNAPNASAQKGGVIVLSPQMSVFTESCLPERMHIKSIIHIGNISRADFERRSLSGRPAGKGQKLGNSKSNPPEHIHILTPGSIRLAGDVKRYDFNKSWTSVVQSRIAAARKLHFASNEGKSLNNGKEESMFADFEDSTSKKGDMTAESEQNLRKGIAGKIEALRNKLKILMSVPLPDDSDSKEKGIKCKLVDSNTEVMKKKDENSEDRLCKTDSSSTIREKMEILGMIAAPMKGAEMHKLAELGRSLAATRWMDSTFLTASTVLPSPASPFSVSSNLIPSIIMKDDKKNDITVCGECYPWGEVRYGASYDSESLKARSILNAFRDYVTSKAGGKVPKRLEESKNISKKLEKKLKNGRIVGFGWRPHIRGDSEWGGAYGKSCGHNEVVMFYCRPFVPLEVLNTHVCSKVSPAPGNDGYDGCLEFLQSQCRWFEKSMSLWDDKYFHFISPDGINRPMLKNDLLKQSIPRLKVIMLNMRYLTVQCGGQIDPQNLLDTVNFLLLIANGSVIIDGLKCNMKICRIICSYLLLGTSSSWTKANKSNLSLLPSRSK